MPLVAFADTGGADAKPLSDSRPNIIFVLCDDLGYGDVQCLNPENGKIPTPAADTLASQGMIFTDAHSGSSVCTPTRYGLMTGRYSWRTSLQRGVVKGFAPNLIAEDRPTVASFLKKQGYHTAIIGKWHLNFQYVDPVSGEVLDLEDWKQGPPVGSMIPDGPLTRGFDYYHGFHHARHMKAVIANDRVLEQDAEINMLPRLAEKAVEYIDQRAQDTSEQPFFLYLPLGSPHTPIVPSAEWQGKSELGSYGDFVMQTDAALGAVIEALHRNGMTENTLLIYTSDNGCSKAAKIDALRNKGHLVSAQFRGSKADLWEGGHRVPFIVRWPGMVEAATLTDQLICLTDFFATVVDIIGAELPAGSCEDSVSFLPSFSGQPVISERKSIIHHSISGHFSYREDKWKLLLARGSGGWTSPKESEAKTAPEAQLYNLDADPSEAKNLYQSHPEIANRLLHQLESYVFSGRSTHGVDSPNDFKAIELWKSGRD
ncbi:MAG TPA: arylsulfatase [Opitutae bacterium]|nr:arylsulfatase [Opitutae bacterium]